MSSPRLVLAENPNQTIEIDDVAFNPSQHGGSVISLAMFGYGRGLVGQEPSVWAWITTPRGARQLRQVPVRDIIIVRDDLREAVPA